MAVKPHRLLERLEAIGASLAQSGHALALIGLGSVGLELERLDAWSDLDFFAIVETGFKQRYLDDLSWLSRLCPVAYCFLNTRDGYKLLYADGIFCEFAVFEPDELRTIPFAPGRMVWKRSDAPDSLSQPILPVPAPARRDRDWLLGEALTNLLVGLQRDRRGEKLSAMRFIQRFAVERLIELVEHVEKATEVTADSFDPHRRFERRYPGLVEQLGSWMQGYQRNRQSALAILDYLEEHFPVNRDLAAAIRELGKGNEEGNNEPA